MVIVFGSVAVMLETLFQNQFHGASVCLLARS
jgi:hypothetical protein